MAIRWDPLLCAASALALDRRVSGDAARALLLDRDQRVAALFLRDQTLVLELGSGWLTIVPPRDPPAVAHRLHHRVHTVASPFDESAITIHLVPSRGRAEPLILTFELIGTRRNAIVFETQGGVIRHVLSPREGERPLHVGAVYEPPTPTGRHGPDVVTSHAEWDRALSDGEAESGLRRRILERLALTSSINVDWILDDDSWERWRTIADPTRWDAFLIPGRDGPQPYPVPLGEPAPPPSSDRGVSLGALLERGSVGPFSDILTAFGVGRSASEATDLASVLSPAGPASVAVRALERARKRARALGRELERAPDPEALRGTGNLILARLNELSKGMKTASLTDFMGTPVDVRLDPALTPAENADAFYRRAGRAERARESLPDRIEAAGAEVRRLEALLTRHEAGELSDTSLSQALGPVTAKRPKDPAEEGPALPYRSLWSSGGLEIRVGRGARHNDDLTFHHSAPDDIWLHALQTSGAHVILRWGKGDRPPRRDLTEAAVIAALNSSARHSGSVPVGWTRRKYVRKPRGSAPGAVVPERIETVFVSPDPALPERLGESPGSA